MTEMAYLLNVSPDGNHNKYYRMVRDGATLKVEYGRVGANPMKRTYPADQWYAKYREKIGKGYVDKTDLYLAQENGDEFMPIYDPLVRHMAETLLRAARQYTKRHYTFTTATDAAMREARSILNAVRLSCDADTANELLLKLFATIPRRMSNVSDHLVKDVSEIPKVLQDEYSLLDAMEGQVVTNAVTPTSDKTILEANGLSVRVATDEEAAEVKRLMGEDAWKAKTVYAVKNDRTEGRLDGWCKDHLVEKKDRHLLFHGSITENFWNILVMGLDPAKANRGMFGWGSCFANRAKKSLRYSSLAGYASIRGTERSGWLAVFEVAYRKPWHVKEWTSECSSFTKDKIRRKGCDAVYAHRGKSLQNDEFIIYDRAQCSIRFMIEVER